jgi:hypothetical protein
MHKQTSELAAIMGDYGDRWQIIRNDDPPSWLAISRPTPTASHVLVALDLAGLRAKLETAHPRPT